MANTVLITGATGGIGAATSRRFAANGYRILAFGRNQSKLDLLIAELPGAGHLAFAGDAQELEPLEAIAKQIAALEPQIVIHALGGTLNVKSAAAAASEWQAVFNVNLHSIISIDRPLVDSMLRRSSGRIVHICSSSAISCKGSAPYGAAKAALAHYSRHLGKTHARHGVIVSGFCPGIVESPTNWGKAKSENPHAYQTAVDSQPIGRLQTPEEIAACLYALCQPEAAIYAGCIVNADGSL